MKLPRTQRVFAALLTVLSLLFTQLAVAAYACPDLVMEAMAAKVMQDAMPGCTEMNVGKPGLCQAHCASGHQSLDAPATPHIGAFIATGMVAVIPIRVVFDSELPTLVSSTLLARSTAPPLAIRHCCFRI
ncbi:hypothetical protein [Pseudoduganella aquatica]|uniref:hypothetical protein n=1 Tax=Pseudoduganella aquatica TaxID=2660641 RepID=UPI001E4A14D6|nr:hypothetical protein [Pseudoduganella aquatica]